MKKFICCALAVAVLLCTLVSCGKAKFKIDGKEFTFAFAYSTEKAEVVACSADNSYRHENTKIVNYTLRADDGKLTFTGADGTAEGEYSVYKKGEDYVIYKVSVGGESGYASLTFKKSGDSTKQYFLMFTISGYTVQFESENFAE